MAAMGAQPKWATLSIALPTLDAAWLEGFSDGLFACADSFQVALIGGDTTRGPLNISITILGEVPVGQALRRDTAQAGDDIWVSGCLGSAALWLQAKLGKLTLTEQEMQAWSLRMHRPQPRVALGLALRGIAHSALDISDGLLSDLGHVLDASKVGAQLDWLQIPQPEHRVSEIASDTLQQAVLAGGDDYELCFTAPVAQRAALQALAVSLQLPLTRIGSITAQPGLQVLDGEQSIGLTQHGYNHFG
jgi:thiamine-monophosphate kinase